MSLVVDTDEKRVSIDVLNRGVEMLLSSDGFVTTLVRFTASEALEVGIVLQREAEKVLRG